MSLQQGPLDLGELRGSVAVVTGAGNGGIGWGLAKHAAGQLGMDVALLDLHATLVDRAAVELAEAYPSVRCIGFRCDVTSEKSVAAAAAAVKEQFPGRRIGACFANAGVIFNKSILHSPIEDWATTLQVNVLGVVNTIKAFVPPMQSDLAPSIMCCTASIGGLVRGDGGAASYQASKHAVVALSESLSFELALRWPQIRVHVLCPCIANTALGTTSQTNKAAAAGVGGAAAAVVERATVPQNGFGMTPERHAQQTFDHIAAGRFYALTDNVRPYVDHDFPFGGIDIVQERVENLLKLQLDNADAFEPASSRPFAVPSSIMKGPMFHEMKRRSKF